MIARGQALAALYFNQDFQALFDQSTDPMKQALSIETWKVAYDQAEASLGKEVAVTQETVQSAPNGYFAYQRHAQWDKLSTPLVMTIGLTPSGELAGFQISPVKQEAESAFLDYTTQTELNLPLTNTWTVIWGGRTVDQNYHAAYNDQRFALDLLIVNEGKSFRTDGKTSAD